MVCVCLCVGGLGVRGCGCVHEQRMLEVGSVDNKSSYVAAMPR